MNKNIRIVGLSLCIAAIAYIVGCDALMTAPDNTATEGVQVIKNEPAPNVDAANRPSPGGNRMAANSGMADEDSKCDPGAKNQCVIIPATGCFGCMQKGGASRAVNMEAAKRIMQPMKEKCMKEMQTFKPDKDNMSQDETCRYDKSVCSPEGRCVFANMTEQEKEAKKKQFQAMMEKMKQQGNRMGMNR
jgi:hypothetical protein